MKFRWYALTVLIACFAGILQSGALSSFEGRVDGLLASTIGGPFTLIDHQGQTRTDIDFSGKYLLVYFGYTFCPDICPTALLQISASLEKLEDAQSEKRGLLQPLFVTLDPARDAQENLAQYVEFFHPDLIGLTGSEEQIRTITENYHVYFELLNEENNSSYLLDHSSVIYLMGPDGEFIRHFTHESSSDEIAGVLTGLIDQAGG